MDNKAIASQFKLLSNLTELLDENKFKARSYQTAYQVIRSYSVPLAGLGRDEILGIKGIGKNIADKIEELIGKGEMDALQSRMDQIPSGVIQMLSIKGLGPKKIKALWRELGIESPEDLRYACLENRLTLLKGFGEKTQRNVLEKVDFFLKSVSKRRYADLVSLVNAILLKFIGDRRIEVAGSFYRGCNIIEQLVFVYNFEWKDLIQELDIDGLSFDQEKEGFAMYENALPLCFHKIPTEEFELYKLKLSFPKDLKESYDSILDQIDSVGEFFEALGLPENCPELLDWHPDELSTVLRNKEQLISESDIKGLVHCHSTYSDGRNAILEMAEAAQSGGLQYMVLTDHSQSAFYANGLTPERVLEQHAEIEHLNQKFEGFKIFKGIESDIKLDGSLDYEPEILGLFDVIIASVHAHLNMDERKATNRIIRAIENPYTQILGHPTGRLLLGRKGYPLDHQKIIEACAQNNVAIEVNSNPWRLDLDWRWIPLCKSLGVPLLICPDAHEVSGIDDIRFGVISARKGGMSPEICLNCLDAESFLKSLRPKPSV